MPGKRGSEDQSSRGRRIEGRRPAARTSWDPLAQWYDGWVGEGGSEHHRRLAVPAVLRLLNARPDEAILDIGCGQGVLAPAIRDAGARYVGVDASPRLIDLAKRHHPSAGTFLVADARRLLAVPELQGSHFDAVVFLLSLQDMDPLEPVIASAAALLREGGRAVLLLTHPAFRIPRQSGWGWDDGRKLMYRRIDRYLTPLPVPLKALPGKDSRATTRSFHRPLQSYVNALGASQLLTDHIEELPGYKLSSSSHSPKAEETARTEIPLFLALRAIKVAESSS
jgi:SAM-dependent methyltransferase